MGQAIESQDVLVHPKMEEVSGLVASGQYPDLLWAHNDSGNEPFLFALNTKGQVLLPDKLAAQAYVSQPPKDGETLFPGIAVEGATLKDWEAIARCDTMLYITEMGNNLNASKSLGIYEIEEPDPRSAESVKPKRFIKIRYPDQKGFPPTDKWNYDCEAVFCVDRKLYFVTKNRPAFRLFVQQGSADLYRLDLDKLVEDNVLEHVDRIANLGGWVTGADISADGRWMALVCESPTQGIWLFERPAEGDRFFTNPKSVRRYAFWGGGQLESLAFAPYQGQEHLFMINEEREFFRIPLDRFVEVAAP